MLRMGVGWMWGLRWGILPGPSLPPLPLTPALSPEGRGGFVHSRRGFSWGFGGVGRKMWFLGESIILRRFASLPSQPLSRAVLERPLRGCRAPLR